MKVKLFIILIVLMFHPMSNFAFVMEDGDPEEIILDKEDKSTTSRPRELIICSAYYHVSDKYVEVHLAGMGNVDICILNSEGERIEKSSLNSEMYSVLFFNIPSKNAPYTIIINSDNFYAIGYF